MNAETRLEIIRQLQEAEIGMIDTKGREYTGGAEIGNERDTLANFKDVAKQTGMTPMQCWGVYFLKHISSITTFISSPEREADMAEPIDGRIIDARTYLGLLMCLIEEARGTDTPKAAPEALSGAQEPAGGQSLPYAVFVHEPSGTQSPLVGNDGEVIREYIVLPGMQAPAGYVFREMRVALDEPVDTHEVGLD